MLLIWLMRIYSALDKLCLNSAAGVGAAVNVCDDFLLVFIAFKDVSAQAAIIIGQFFLGFCAVDKADKARNAVKLRTVLLLRMHCVLALYVKQHGVFDELGFRQPDVAAVMPYKRVDTRIDDVLLLAYGLNKFRKIVVFHAWDGADNIHRGQRVWRPNIKMVVDVFATAPVTNFNRPAKIPHTNPLKSFCIRIIPYNHPAVNTKIKVKSEKLKVKRNCWGFTTIACSNIILLYYFQLRPL